MIEETGKHAIEAAVRLLGRSPRVEHAMDRGVLKIKGSPDGFDIKGQDNEVEATIFARPWREHEVAGFLAPLIGKKSVETLSNSVITADQVPLK